MRLGFFSAALAGALALMPAAWAEAPPAPEVAQAVAPAFRLIMVEREGCVYCALWNEKIGPIYPKTPEGAAAPLTRVDIHANWAEGLTTGPAPIYTPTFIVLRGTAEVGRIEGYPGEDFFWALLGQALGAAGALPPPS